MLSLKQKKTDGFVHVSRILEEYPELYRFSFDPDEVALKLKYLALFYNSTFRRWRFPRPRDSYFFRRDFVERVISEFLHGGS